MSAHAEGHGSHDGDNKQGVLSKLVSIRGPKKNPTAVETIGYAGKSIMSATRAGIAALFMLPFAAVQVPVSVTSNLLGKTSEVLDATAAGVNNMGAGIAGGIAGKSPDSLPQPSSSGGDHGGGHDEHH